MTTDTVEPSQPSLLTPAAASVTQNTICIVVRKGRFGTKRKASKQSMADDVTVQADKRLLALSKCILESPELKKVQQLDGEMQSYLKELCLKSMFRGGVYLIHIKLVGEVNAALLDFESRRKVLVDAAYATYDQRIAETSARLDVLHDPTDYPNKERFKQCFYFDWQFVTWDTPTKLKELNAAIFEAEREKAAIKLSAVADDCRAVMREGMAQLVDAMLEKLTPGPDGKQKSFTKATIKNFNEFFRTFEMKNVTDDVALATVAAQAKAVLSGVDVDSMRVRKDGKNDALREAMKQQLAMLKERLAPLTEEMPSRQIDLDEDDDEGDDDA